MKTENSSAPLVFHADKVTGDLGAFVAFGVELTPEGWAAVQAACITPEKVLPATAFGFPNVTCSQCGASFGPGDSGFSHCRDHQRRPADLERKVDQAIQRGPQIAKDMGVRLPTVRSVAALPRWAVTVLLLLLLVVLPAISLHLGDPDGFDRSADMAQRSLLLDELEVQP